MKSWLVLVLLVILLISGFWAFDITKDQENSLFVSGKVIAYNKWDCSNKDKQCDQVFSLDANTRHDVYRIRYGKDFMAIKVKKENKMGWVIQGENTELIEKSMK